MNVGVDQSIDSLRKRRREDILMSCRGEKRHLTERGTSNLNDFIIGCGSRMCCRSRGDVTGGRRESCEVMLANAKISPMSRDCEETR